MTEEVSFSSTSCCSEYHTQFLTNGSIDAVQDDVDVDEHASAAKAVAEFVCVVVVLLAVVLVELSWQNKYKNSNGSERPNHHFSCRHKTNNFTTLAT
jgi:hypothetical protein